MEEKITLNLSSDDDFSPKITKAQNPLRLNQSTDKKWLVFLIIGIVGLLGGVGAILFTFLMPEPEVAELAFPSLPTVLEEKHTYSALTGEPLADGAQVNAPVYCIQTPNGTDGARPQSGLNEAGVVFEAIAEAGITRFAAIYQNPNSAAIGPIRSLRLYYLQWDTPFDCAVVHAGGADDALAALRSGGYKDLTENYSYMYRGTYRARLWNNLFTNATDLRQFGADTGFAASDIHGFTRMTPEESEKSRVDNMVSEKLVITKPTTVDTSVLTPKVAAVSFYYGNVPAYNIGYSYDLTTNSYLRFYGNGNAHEVYACPAEDLGERNPEDVCTLTQMNPKVVIAMLVSERKAEDNYHEDITAIGSGTAYIFQNGVALQGTWNKVSWEDQIKFLDADGNEVKLAPGQTFISAVPDYGGVEY